MRAALEALKARKGAQKKSQAAAFGKGFSKLEGFASSDRPKDPPQKEWHEQLEEEDEEYGYGY